MSSEREAILSDSKLTVSHAGDVTIVSMNDPGTLNALGPANSPAADGRPCYGSFTREW
jgi:hypothetical protein